MAAFRPRFRLIPAPVSVQHFPQPKGDVAMNMQPMLGVAAPAEPRELRETGLSPVMMRDILLKTIFRTNLGLVSDLSRVIALPNQLTQSLIEAARGQRLIEAMGTLNATSGPEMSYQLTDAGKARAIEALKQSEYYGAMPVPLQSYAAQMKRQSVRDIKLTRADLVASMGHLILPADLISNLGPAVTSGRSILMYGPPGNGKSSISNGIRAAMGDCIYVPRAIEYSGQVITVYDPIVHSLAPDSAVDPNSLRRTGPRFDTRYVHCQRPTVITGGELTLDMLDLKYNAVARTYQAPLQLKASGGIFIVDDLGRQVEPPQKLVNRWIVPLEEGRDILQLQSGEKFTVPFDTLVIFSTNYHPNEIFDGAALRRIFFKIKIDGPTQEMFLSIFAMVARKKHMPLDEASVLYLLREKYPTIENNFANYQPTFLIDQIIAINEFEGEPYHMTPELIDRAWANMFVKQEHIAK